MNWNARQNREQLAYINKTTREDMQDDPRIKELAEAALKTCVENMKTFKEQGALFEKEDSKGNMRIAAMSVKVVPSLDKSAEPKKIKVNGKTIEEYPVRKDKDGNDLYTITGNIVAKDGSSLSTLFSNRINEDGTVNAVSVYYSKFSNQKLVENAKGIEDIKNSKAPDEIKTLVDAFEKNHFIKNYNGTELSNLAVHLNKDVFKEKVIVEVEKDGKKEDAERKLVNAKYENTQEYGEYITLFNKSSNEEERNVNVRLYMKDDEIVAYAVNNALTYNTDEGKVMPKMDKSEKSLGRFINNEVDIVNYLPEIDELRQAVAEVKNIDWDKVKEAEAEAAKDNGPDNDGPDSADDFTAVADDFTDLGGDLPF